MSYQVLARKWRPHNFKQVVGQQHVLTALINALQQQRLHHAYLFSGTRGVGKTSIARILAKSLNCETGVTAEPCGQCDHCQAIDQGRFVDLLEIDAASRTKVEDTRELLDNVQYKPAQGRYKVYLIDEVHMLSKHSFNALLKTLEEPPEYVKFLLATTDPQKLPITILSRCLQFHLKSLPKSDISQQLSHILQQEQHGFEPAALDLLAKAANGSMRDALSLTDQAIAFGNGEVQYQSVLSMLGTLDHKQVFDLLRGVSQGDVNLVFAQVAQLVSLGPDFDQVLNELASALHQIALAQMLPSTASASDDNEAITELAKLFSAEQVQLCYQIALKGRQDLPLAPEPRVGLEMTLMRMLAFRPAPIVDTDPAIVARQSSQSVLPSGSQQPVVEDKQLSPSEPSTPNTINTPSASEPTVVAEPQTAVSPAAVPTLPAKDAAETTSNTADAHEAVPGVAKSEPLKPANTLQQTTPSLIDSPRLPSNGTALAHETSQHTTEQSVRVNRQLNPVSEPQGEATMHTGQSTSPVLSETAAPVEPVMGALAKRNMLRSRKKALQSGEKKTAITTPKAPLAPESLEPSPAPAIERAPVTHTEMTPSQDARPELNQAAAAQTVASELNSQPGAQTVVSEPNSQPAAPQGQYHEGSTGVPAPHEHRQINPSADKNANIDPELPPLDAYSQDYQAYFQAGDLAPGMTDASLVSAVQTAYDQQGEQAAVPPQADATTVAAHSEPLTTPAITEVPARAQTTQLKQESSGGATEPNNPQPMLPVPNTFSESNQDPWCQQINQLGLSGILRQLALNSVAQALAPQLSLLLQPAHQHLNNEKNQQALLAACQQVYGESASVHISIGDSHEQQTPVEIEQAIYLARLNQAKQDIAEDEAIQFFIQRFAAVVDEESIKPI